ncbi:MAG: glycosyltransferase [Planctomycetaceae bacterium]|nr:glycosyltransferase [Planctomycetaceae bacterium]
MDFKKIRVLHVFGDLGCAGGAEKWFLEILKLQDPRIQFDFITSVCNKSVADEVTALGATIHYIPFSHSSIPFCIFNPYLNSARKILQQHKYDVLHVHQFDLAGELLRIAQLEQVKTRVMTIHASKYDNPRILRRLAYLICGKNWIFKHATNILPCSQYAAQSFNCTNPLKTKIIYPAINPTYYNLNSKKQSQLKSYYQNIFNIPPNSITIGHIGRFTKQKNHQFLIKLLAQLIQDNKNIHALLIGTGELLPKIKQDIVKLDLQKHIILAGKRNDVPNIINSIFDVLVLPSLYEGLPIVALEALASGLAVVLSDKITTELDDYFSNRIFREKLEIKNWLNAIPLAINAKINNQEAMTEFLNSPFNIKNSLENLINIYNKALK